MTMSTAQRLVKLKGKMCDNLTAMGVENLDPSQTLIQLSDEILNIPPTVVGIELDTTIGCASDKQSVTVGDTVTFTGTLKAFYDDETQADVDLEGVLQGATVKVYNGNVLLGTATTNQLGVYSYVHTVSSSGDLAVKAVFEGTDDYKDSYSSTVVVEVVAYDGIVLSAQKPVLSYKDSDKTDLYAQLMIGQSSASVSGVTITFKQGNTVLGTATTNATGKATLSDGYTSAGVGDVSLTATDGSLLSETYGIQDCSYYNDGSNVGSLEVGNNVSCTSNGEYITITTSTSGEKDVKLPVALTGDWEFETTLAETLQTGAQLTFKIGTGQQWGAFNNPDNTITVNLGSSQNFNKTVQKDMTYKITYINGVMTVYWNNEQLASKTLTLDSGVKIGYYTNNGRYQYIKNIKLKPL